MKTCSNCGASNANIARFCSECGASLLPGVGPGTELMGSEKPHSRESASAKATSAAKSGAFASSLAATITGKGDVIQGKRKADVLFVLDCTGSMQGEIDAIRDAITGFADTIKSDGVRVRVGLIEFRDRLIKEDHRALKFGGEVFTTDPVAFRNGLATLRASGGGDAPESSLDALMLALKQPFASDAQKVIVLVTDAPPHIPDKSTRSIEAVVEELRVQEVQQLYLVIRTMDPSCQIYLKLLEGTKGLAFEMGSGADFRSRADDFKRTLMQLGKTISSATR